MENNLVFENSLFLTIEELAEKLHKNLTELKWGEIKCKGGELNIPAVFTADGSQIFWTSKGSGLTAEDLKVGNFSVLVLYNDTIKPSLWAKANRVKYDRSKGWERETDQISISIVRKMGTFEGFDFELE